MLETINNQLALSYYRNLPLDNLKAINVEYYLARNKAILNHFENHSYPENVKFIKVDDLFCDSQYCFSVKNGIPLYFDDDHPSILAAEAIGQKIIDLRNKELMVK